MRGAGKFLHRKEVMIQGYPLDMILFWIKIVPLTGDIWAEHPAESQPWYSDNARAGGTFRRIKPHLEDLMTRVLQHGYLPKLTKSILIVLVRNPPQAKDFLSKKLVIGGRYLTCSVKKCHNLLVEADNFYHFRGIICCNTKHLNFNLYKKQGHCCIV